MLDDYTAKIKSKTYFWQASKEWFVERAESAYIKFWLFVLSFTESSIFIIPPDPLLIAVLLTKTQRWAYYAWITTLASVLGSIFGYALGYFFFDSVGHSIISLYGVESQFEYVKNLFNESSFWVLFIAAFTPIPFKVFVLSAGFLKSGFISFITATILGRGARYFGLAYGINLFGEVIVRIVKQYSIPITILSVLLLCVYLCIKFYI